MNLDCEHFYTVATDRELNDLLEGKEAGSSTVWGKSALQQVTPGLTGVLWMRCGIDKNARPLVLVVRQEDQKRLYGRYVALRSDLSPLTAWCHILTPQRFEHLNSLHKTPEYKGLEAAWAGLAIAEARLLTEKPTNDIRISACLATQSFAVARTTALWSDTPPLDVAERCGAARQLVRPFDQEDSRTSRLRDSLVPIWDSLNDLMAQSEGCSTSESQPIVSSLRALMNARLQNDPSEALLFATPLLKKVPELKPFDSLLDLTSEQRLRLFDRLVEQLWVASSSEEERLRRLALPMVAGYLATVAAGGKSSLNMAEKLSSEWPEITAWAYTIGGLGEKITWTASFDGLGRLVARELTRPIHLDEPPNYDISLEEASILVDRKLGDPLVHLRIKQARILTVSLLPGVNFLVAVGETRGHGIEEPVSVTKSDWPNEQLSSSKVDPIHVLVEALWPYIRRRFEYMMKDPNLQVESRAQSLNKQKGKAKGKRRSQQNLYHP